MKNTYSYSVRISGFSQSVADTAAIYREAVWYLLSVVRTEWKDIEPLSAKDSAMHIEKLVHGTSARSAKYRAFDARFYKFPSYLRRSAISVAVAHYRSWKAFADKWLDEGEQGKRPFFNAHPLSMPCFYRGNMFRRENGVFMLKVYRGGDWVFVPVAYKKSDLRYIEARESLDDASAPVLERRGKGYALRFSFSSYTKLPEKVHAICSAARGKKAGLPSYSLCRFPTGKIYNCDLSASYNIGARYYIRDVLSMQPEARLIEILAKVPEAAKRTTCTLGTLIRLCAVLSA